MGPKLRREEDSAAENPSKKLQISGGGVRATKVERYTAKKFKVKVFKLIFCTSAIFNMFFFMFLIDRRTQKTSVQNILKKLS